MSKTVINKREQIKWNNGFDPNGKSIPDITAEDEGKILKVEEGVLVFGEDAGAVLPSYSSSDEGKVLKVDSNGDLEWGTDEGIAYTAGDNVEISAENEISSVNTIVFNAKYFRATDTFQYDATAIAPFLAEVFKNDKRAIVRVQDGNYNIFDIYTLQHYESYNNIATFTKTQPIIVSASQREIVCSHIALSVVNGTGTLSYTNEGVTDLPEGATQGQIPISDGNNGWVAGNIPTELPSVSSADEGKVLKVDSNGDWAVGTDNDTTYSAGTGITITGTSISADSQLPSYSSGDNGKVLSVDSNGDLEWSTPSGGSSYTAGDGIEISAQDVISSPDAVMAKEGIADAYEGLTFYPAFTSAGQSSGNNMYTDCCAAASTEPFPGDIRVTGVRVYTLDGTEAYWYLKHGDDQDIWHIDIIVPTSSTVQGTVYVDYIDSNGNKTYTSDIDIAQNGRPFSGTVNPGKWWDFEIQGGSQSVGFPIIQCAFDLSNCVYTSDQAGYDEFGNNPIPTENYNNGDQVWKDGKLQTYSSGSWVDSDTIVEQIADVKAVPNTTSSNAGKVLAVSTSSPYGYSWEDSTIAYTVTYDSGTDTYSLPSGVTFSSINTLLNKGRTVELLYDNKRHRCSSVTSSQIDFDATIGGMAGLVGNSTIRVKSNNTVTANVTYSMPMKDTANYIYRFEWTADSADIQDYTATQDCFVVVRLVGVSGESGSANTLGINYSILIGTTSSNAASTAHGRFTTMSGVNPEYTETFFLRKGWVISIRHFIRNTGTASSFVVYPVK